MAVAAMIATTTLTSCSDNDDIIDGIPDQTVVLNCAKTADVLHGDQQQVNTADITAPATPAAVRMRLAGKIE